jgi:hypothetical protein
MLGHCGGFDCAASCPDSPIVQCRNARKRLVETSGMDTLAIAPNAPNGFPRGAVHRIGFIDSFIFGF